MPNATVGYLGFGKLMMKLGDLRMALNVFQRGRCINAQHSEINQLMGVLYCELGQADMMRRYFRMAIIEQPWNSVGYYDFGVCTRNLGNSNEARQFFQWSIYLEPKRADYHFSLANVQRYKGDENHVSELHSLLKERALRC